MNYKKSIIIISCFFMILIILFGLLLIGQPKKSSPPFEKNAVPTSVPIIIPTSSFIKLGTQSQEQADQNFSKELIRSRQNFQWYSSLPLKDPNYFVYFDLNKEVLTARVYSKSRKLSAEQIQAVKREIVSKLMGLGVDIAKFSPVWQEGL